MQKKTLNDNIIAQITPIGTAAIAGLRLSGANVKHFAETFFETKILKTRYAYFIKSKIDELILIYYKAPNSYTGEDTIELFCHGNQNIVNTIIDSFIETFEIRLADPGEFTKRAFLNSKLDLVQAESVIDLINANSKLYIENQKNILKGFLSNKYLSIKKVLLDLLSEAEFEIEFDEDSVFNYIKAKQFIEEIKQEVENLLKVYSTYKNKIDEVLVCIIGFANVGKSSLFNLLLNENRAIVHHEPGTTRDFIEAKLNLGPYNIKLVDTAGFRETSIDSVESIGINKAKELTKEAVLLIEVFDEDFYKPLRDSSILVRNKMDLKTDTYFNSTYLYVSCKDNRNIDLIYNKILQELDSKFCKNFENKQFVSLRQYELLSSLANKLELIIASLEKEKDLDIVTIDIANAVDILNEILGIEVKDELLDNLFSRFCVGK